MKIQALKRFGWRSEGMSGRLFGGPGSLARTAVPDFWTGFSRQADRPPATQSEAGDAEARETMNILVPTDLADSSGAAVDCAFRLARAGSARVTLLHAVHLNLTPYGPADTHQLNRSLYQTAEARMSAFAALACREKISAACLVRDGRPNAVIRDFLAASPVDLVILTLRPRHRLARLFGRRIVENVVRQAQCAVLVLPTGEN